MTKKLSRRFVAAAGVVSAFGLAALGLEAHHLVGQNTHPTPFDDLLSQLSDQDEAAQLGRAVRISVVPFDDKKVVMELEQRFAGHKNLSSVVDTDLGMHRLLDVKGWILPESLALLAACVSATI